MVELTELTRELVSSIREVYLESAQQSNEAKKRGITIDFYLVVQGNIEGDNLGSPMMFVPVSERAMEASVALGFDKDEAVGFMGGRDLQAMMFDLQSSEFVFAFCNPMHPLGIVHEITCTADGAVLH